MYVCACMSCMVRIALSRSDPWGHCMILKFKGKNRQTGTINIGCDSKNRLQNILEVQNLCCCFSIEWSWFPNSGGTPALVGLALRGRGGRNGGSIPAWLALLPACRLVGGLSIKAEAGNKVLCVVGLHWGGQRPGGTSHFSAFLRNTVEVSQTKQTGQPSQKRVKHEACQHRDSGEISGVWGSASCTFLVAWTATLNTYVWRTGWNWLSDHVGTTVAWKTQLCLNSLPGSSS